MTMLFFLFFREEKPNACLILCAECPRSNPHRIVFPCPSPSRAEAQSTAHIPASATRLTTCPWPPWIRWTPCPRPTHPQPSPAAAGSVPACPWCDRPTRPRTARWVRLLRGFWFDESVTWENWIRLFFHFCPPRPPKLPLLILKAQSLMDFG